MSVPEAWSPVTAWVLFLLVVSQVPRTCLQSHSCYGLWTWCTVKEHLTLVPLQPPLFFFLYFPLYLWVYNTTCSWVFCKFIPRKQHFFFFIFLLELSYVLAAFLICVWNCLHWAHVKLTKSKLYLILVQTGGSKDWEQLSGDGLWGIDAWKNWSWPGKVGLQPRKTIVAGAASKAGWPLDQERWFCILLSYNPHLEHYILF